MTSTFQEIYSSCSRSSVGPVRGYSVQVQHFALEVRRPVPHPQAISSELTHREYTLKEHSPTRNQLPLKTHEENSKNSKTQNPHILGVSMKGALSGKKEEKKSADSGSPNPS